MKTKRLTRREKEAMGLKPPRVSKYGAKQARGRSTLADTLSHEARAKLEGLANG